jgi:EthD domain
MVLEAGYPNTTGFRKVVKVTVMIRKKEGMSDEDFINHYNNVHAQMAAPVVQRAGAISYSLVILPLRSYPRHGQRSLFSLFLTVTLQTYHLQRDRKMIQDILHNKAKLLDYDAICTFVFPDYKCLAKFLYDKESAALTSDHENFMDDSQMKMMVGDEYMVIEDGQKVQH